MSGGGVSVGGRGVKVAVAGGVTCCSNLACIATIEFSSCAIDLPSCLAEIY